MGMSNAEKQRRFRQKALKDPDGLLLTRLQVLIGPGTAADLDRIVGATGWTKRRVIERAIKLLARETITA